MKTSKSGAKGGAAGAKAAKKADPASRIMSAPKGPRTVSHKAMKAAVEKVFRDREKAGS